MGKFKTAVKMAKRNKPGYKKVGGSEQVIKYGREGAGVQQRVVQTHESMPNHFNTINRTVKVGNPPKADAGAAGSHEKGKIAYYSPMSVRKTKVPGVKKSYDSSSAIFPDGKVLNNHNYTTHVSPAYPVGVAGGSAAAATGYRKSQDKHPRKGK